MRVKPLVLMILDGWGEREPADDNAISLAKKPNWDRLLQTSTHTLISASGQDVGLPGAQMGNSEVGHVNLGAGRVVYQDLTRIDQAIAHGEFGQNEVLCQALDHAIAEDKAVHILGLLSPGGVHSHEHHIQSMLTMAAERGAKKVYLHAFLDGRDTAPQSALASLQAIDELCVKNGVGRIASLVGRYYAMDRDQRWDRIELAYDLLTQGQGIFSAATAELGLAAAYQREENDEFVQPTVIGTPVKMSDGDSVIFMNFRADRARQLSHALADQEFSNFNRGDRIQLSHFVTLTEYEADLPAEIAYPPDVLKNGLGEVLSQSGLKQLRISETEKYAHVTFFFNGGVEAPFVGEDRVLIASPKVATYDLQPEMSSAELTDKLVAAIKAQSHDVIICNYPNADMVGHTGNLSAAIKAIEALDDCIGDVSEALKAVGGELLITADHGNAEQMFNQHTGQPHTAHTNLVVPLIYMGRDATVIKNKGVLSDIAPTMLYLLGIAQPVEMTGQPIIEVKDNIGK